MPALDQMVRFADDLLRLSTIEDYENALNGLQIENSGAVTKIGAAVDASSRTMQMAVEQGIDLLLVHHGLFWPGLQPITGSLQRALKLALEHNLALYSAASAPRFSSADREQRAPRRRPGSERYAAIS